MRRYGFSLIELLVSLALASAAATAGIVLVLSIVGLTRSEIHLAEMQQSARSAELELGRALRATGRGALPVSRPGDPVSPGVAIEVRNDVGGAGGERTLAIGWAGSPLVSTGSDVLILRGVFRSPVYVVDYRDPETFSVSGGMVRVAAAGIGGGSTQDLGPLEALLRDGRGKPDALLLIGYGDEPEYGVAELEPGRSRDEGDEVVLAFRHRGSELADAFGLLSQKGRFPVDLTRVAYVGVLEEYRFYVRETDSGSALARGRLYPGTEIPWRELSGELKVDVAENVVDLQVALGFDSDLADGRFDSDTDTRGEDDRIVETADGRDDDWLFNSPADDPLDDVWQARPPALPPDLHLVRVRLLSRTARPERHLVQEPLRSLEDRIYGLDADDPINGLSGRRRRRLVSTIIVGPRSL